MLEVKSFSFALDLPISMAEYQSAIDDLDKCINDFYNKKVEKCQLPNQRVNPVVSTNVINLNESIIVTRTLTIYV